MSGYSENVTVDEGIDVQTGIRTKVHFEGDSVIFQKTFDAEPALQYVQALREAQEGKRWGEGRLVGHIPPAFYGPICAIRDPQERKQAIKRFFQDNPQFCGYSPYLK